jgi:hypothetical protein
MNRVETERITGCRFCANAVRCNKPIDRSSLFFCSEHKDHFAGLSNRELLEKAAHSLRAIYYVSENKTVEQTTDGKLLGEMDTLLFELEARGYKPREAVEAITAVQDSLGLNDDLDRAVGRDPKWRKFEKIIAGIHKFAEMGAQVVLDDHVIGKITKRKRQIDVSVRFKHGFYEYLLIVECKNYKYKVPVKDVESLRTKMQDVGADRAVMVTTVGYQAGAIETARAYNIELRTLAEEVSDWTSVVKSEVIRFPFFAGAEFDHDPLDRPLATEWTPLTYDSIVFLRQAEGRSPVTFAELIKNIAVQIHERGERLPAEVTVPFDPPWQVLFPYEQNPFPVRGVTLRFEPYVLRTDRTIDLPPRVSKYIYENVVGQDRREVPANAVPIGLDTVLEPGKYYKNDRGGYYKCLEIKGDDVIWLEMNIRQDENGQAFHGEFTQDMKYACYYLPVTEPVELAGLERVYARLEEYERLTGNLRHKEDGSNK